MLEKSNAEVKLTKTKMKFDDIFSRGRYTFIFCVLLQFTILFQLSNMFFPSFSFLVPKITHCGNTNFVELGWDQKEICSNIQNISLNNACKPVAVADFYSVNMQWNYLCKDALKVKTSLATIMFGVIFGSGLGGILSDKYGRRKVLLIALIFCGIFTAISSLSSELLELTIYRTLVGFFNGITIVITNVFLLECIPKNDKIVITNLISWPLNGIVFAFITYYFAPNWIDLARITSLISIIPILLLCYCICESPRFFIQKGRIMEAKNEIKKILAINKIKIEEVELDEILKEEHILIKSSESSVDKKYSFYHLFYSWDLVGRTLTLSSVFFIASISKYGIMFNMESLSGSIYLNMVYASGCPFILNLIIAAADIKYKWLGRRLVSMTFLISIFLSLSTIGFFHIFGIIKEFETLVRILQILTVCFTGQLFTSGGALSSELYPTGVRNMAYSILQVSARWGGVLAPYFFYLSSISESIPYLSLSLITIVTTIAFFFIIPEAKGKPLNERMPSKEECIFGNKKKIDIEMNEKESEKMLA
uniref:MFS domain-containing protein n=1 Tax=Rhabditophanes sp. KR3021 TaxID=114890 RepID=A0AC35UBG2_9BILA